MEFPFVSYDRDELRDHAPSSSRFEGLVAGEAAKWPRIGRFSRIVSAKEKLAPTTLNSAGAPPHDERS
jgi:hypothetical protein